MGVHDCKLRHNSTLWTQSGAESSIPTTAVSETEHTEPGCGREGLYQKRVRMAQILEGQLAASPNIRVAIAVSRFNAMITEPLLAGAKQTLTQYGVTDLDIAWCPGAFELPLLVSKLAESGRYAAIIALGAVIRGETYHFEVISNAAVEGLQQVALKMGIPVALGVLTADTIEQAMARSAPGNDNKGNEAALAALEMVSLLDGLGKDLG